MRRFETISSAARELVLGVRRIGRRRWIAAYILWGCTAVALFCWPTHVRAGNVDATKVITWTFPAAPAAGAQGNYDWDLECFADDLHITSYKPEKNNALWPMLVGLAKTPKTTGLCGGPIGTEPNSKSDMDFKATAPVAVGGGLFQVTGTMHLEVNANTVAPNAGHGVQTVWANAEGHMFMRGGTVSGVVVKETGKAMQVVPAAGFNNGNVGFGASTRLGTWHDPISVMFQDLDNGSTLIEPLLSLDMSGMVDGEWTWDGDGLSLNVPLDGLSSAMMSLDVMSSWITDPSLVDSFVSLDGGVFSASGIFADLPWMVTSTSASLPGGYLDFINAPYSVPANLIDDTHMYEPSLLIDSFGYVEASAVPEPASLLLLGLVVLSAPRRRRLRETRSR